MAQQRGGNSFAVVENGVLDIEDLQGATECQQLRHDAGVDTTSSLHMSTENIEAIGPPLLKFADVRMVHLEVTDKCNARCPQCGRNDRGGPVHPDLPLTELSVEDVKRLLPEDVCRQLRKVYMCGNFGDPTSAQDLLGVCEYLRACNPQMTVGVHTNGGARLPSWWSKLGAVLQKPCYVRFAIDGLEDTNHIYRQRVNWKKLMANVGAFIAAGGNAEWDYIVFGHNEHQVEVAEALSKELGFSRFQAKKTQRFLDRGELSIVESTPVKNDAGQIVGEIRPPRDPKWLNEALLMDVKRLAAQHGSFEKYLDKATIECKAARDKEIYISAEGLVFPCCWLAGGRYPPPGSTGHMAKLQSSLEGWFAEAGGGFVSGATGLQDAVEGPLFRRVASSLQQPSIAEGRIRTCAYACGQEYAGFAKQFPGWKRGTQPDVSQSSCSASRCTVS